MSRRRTETHRRAVGSVVVAEGERGRRGVDVGARPPAIDWGPRRAHTRAGVSITGCDCASRRPVWSRRISVERDSAGTARARAVRPPATPEIKKKTTHRDVKMAADWFVVRKVYV